MIEEGADVIDVGGESTRPRAEPVGAEEECRRVLPVVAALAPLVRVSIDTTKPTVATAAVEAGATLINDVSSSLAGVAAELDVGIVLMHMLGTPKTMQDSPHYDDVVGEVGAYLERPPLRHAPPGWRRSTSTPGSASASAWTTTSPSSGASARSSRAAPRSSSARAGSPSSA